MDQLLGRWEDVGISWWGTKQFSWVYTARALPDTWPVFALAPRENQPHHFPAVSDGKPTKAC